MALRHILLLLLACCLGVSALDFCGRGTFCPNGFFCCFDGMCCNTVYFSLGITFLVLLVIGIVCGCCYCRRTRRPGVVMVHGHPPGMVPPGTTAGSYPGMVIAQPPPPGTTVGSYPAMGFVAPGAATGSYPGMATSAAVSPSAATSSYPGMATVPPGTTARTGSH